MADDDKETKKDAPTGPSKFPDLKELGTMASKLFGDVKQSVTEIIADYKKKRPEQAKKAPAGSEAKPKEDNTAKAEEPPEASDTKDDDKKDA